jgi:hypothetical protein
MLIGKENSRTVDKPNIIDEMVVTILLLNKIDINPAIAGKINATKEKTFGSNRTI